MAISYYKFIDEDTNPIVFSGWYEENGEIITNPPAEKILALGYKPIVEAEYPTLESDQYVEVYWTEQDSTNKFISSKTAFKFSSGELFLIPVTQNNDL